MNEIFLQLLGLLDPILIFWAIVLNILGFHLKRVGLPKSCPPMPILLYIVAFVPCFALGWVKVDGFTGKAALEALLYAISNAGFIVLPAIFGYDIVHAFTGKNVIKCKYVFTFDTKTDKKLSTIVYGSTALGVLAISWPVAFFVFREGIIYSTCWTALAVGVSCVIARIVLHEIKKVADAEDYAIDVYCLVACAAWLGLILTTSWLFVSLFGAVLAGALMMAFGTRFMDPVDDKNQIVDVKKLKRLAGETELEFLCRTVRYRYVDDNMDCDADPYRPLCKVGDEAMTVEEADKAGQGSIAGEGIEYLKMLIRKRDEEEED